ncbi:hypothetical protein I5S63_06725, partial [Pseudomonas juntendi]|nr:hypothetical protein [Pseudomonas juntendi]
MPRRNRYMIAVLLLILVSALFGYLWRDTPPAQPALPAHSYAKALRPGPAGRGGGGPGGVARVGHARSPPRRGAAPGGAG